MVGLASTFQSNGLYFWFLLAAIIIILVMWVVALQIRLNRVLESYDRLTAGGSARNLTEILHHHVTQIDEITDRVDEVGERLQVVETGLKQSVQQIGLVRFNPFADTGGDQSFAVAMLDAEGDGVVFSSLFSRSESRIFAKPITRGKSRYALTDEERQAIQHALEEKKSPDVVTPG